MYFRFHKPERRNVSIRCNCATYTIRIVINSSNLQHACTICVPIIRDQLITYISTQRLYGDRQRWVHAVKKAIDRICIISKFGAQFIQKRETFIIARVDEMSNSDHNGTMEWRDRIDREKFPKIFKTQSTFLAVYDCCIHNR